MPWDIYAATKYADSHAKPKSIGKCAEYVRKAIEKGGIYLSHTLSAKNYGPIMKAAGFSEILTSPKAGDVVVIQPAPGHPHGHMAIYDGTQWVSDFKQQHGFYPGASYRAAKPIYKIYRHD